jgi:hypothetical protein
MDISSAIRTRDVDALKAVTGIPRRTLYRWAQLGKVSGTGVVHDLRLKLLKDGLKKVPVTKDGSKKRAKAAA